MNPCMHVYVHLYTLKQTESSSQTVCQTDRQRKTAKSPNGPSSVSSCLNKQTHAQTKTHRPEDIKMLAERAGQGAAGTPGVPATRGTVMLTSIPAGQKKIPWAMSRWVNLPPAPPFGFYLSKMIGRNTRNNNRRQVGAGGCTPRWAAASCSRHAAQCLCLIFTTALRRHGAGRRASSTASDSCPDAPAPVSLER